MNDDSSAQVSHPYYLKVNKPAMLYTDSFYSGLKEGTQQSADTLVPIVLEQTSSDSDPIKSVVDIGCGLGQFLKAFKNNGVEDIVGVDGDHVSLEQLVIPPDCFVAKDLEESFYLGRSFDLAVSLEVAEHLHPSSAEHFVASLVRHASLILFSAAIPGQGGTGHINCRWPSYWAQIFERQGYLVQDIFRERIWDDNRISWWYRQNLLLFAKVNDLPRGFLFDILNKRHPQCR
jgi:SAM-dependent methyltransferase